MRTAATALFWGLVLGTAVCWTSFAGPEPQKVLYINSYHQGYAWSDDIEKGLLKALGITTNPDGSFDTSQSAVDLEIFRMDTKFNTSEDFKQQAALAAKARIDEWQPDIVVASDDNAAKYVIAPYFKDSDIPFVFCGLNGDASVYGFPESNVTGMLEVAPYLETIEMLRIYARGDRIGIIGTRSVSNHKEITHFRKLLPLNQADIKLVSHFDEWKTEYVKLQDAVDMIIWFSPVGITGWRQKQAIDFILEHTTIPTGGAGDHNVAYALLGMVKIAEEQGWWSGKTALRILNGTSPADIPVTTNKESKIFLNMQLAKRLGIKFPMTLLEKATFVEEMTP